MSTTSIKGLPDTHVNNVSAVADIVSSILEPSDKILDDFGTNYTKVMFAIETLLPFGPVENKLIIVKEGDELFNQFMFIQSVYCMAKFNPPKDNSMTINKISDEIFTKNGKKMFGLFVTKSYNSE